MSILLYILRQFSSFCGQLKLYADDGKKYLSDVINEKGVRLILVLDLEQFSNLSKENWPA